MQHDLQNLGLQLNSDEEYVCHNYMREATFNVERGCLDYIEDIAKAVESNSTLFYGEYCMSENQLYYIYNYVKKKIFGMLFECNLCDHYFREISALKLLGIKNKDLPNGSGTVSYQIAKCLSTLDNGSFERKQVLRTLAWLISEYTKNSEICDRVRTSLRHSSYAKKRRSSIIKKIILLDDSLYANAIINEAIEGIYEKLKTQKTIRQYSQLFHLLTLLGVPRNSNDVPATSTNIKYDIAYFLWWLDIEADIDYSDIEKIIEYCEKL